MSLAPKVPVIILYTVYKILVQPKSVFDQVGK
jgi:hypothetical protein